MKKILCWLVIFGMVCLPLYGCGEVETEEVSVEEPEEITAEVEEEMVAEWDPEEWEGHYQEVLEYYYNQLKDGWTPYPDTEVPFEGDSERSSFLADQGELSTVGYELIDLNEDGTPELVINMMDQEEPCGELYGYVNEKPLHLQASHVDQDGFYIAENHSIICYGGVLTEWSSVGEYVWQGEKSACLSEVISIYHEAEDRYTNYYGKNMNYEDWDGENVEAFAKAHMMPITEEESEEYTDALPKARKWTLTSFEEYGRTYHPEDEKKDVKNETKQETVAKEETQETSQKNLTKDQAYDAVVAYCKAEDPTLQEDDLNFGWWGDEEIEGDVYKVTYRSYTGSYMYFYVNVKTGHTTVEEYVPFISEDILPSDITFNAYDYL